MTRPRPASGRGTLLGVEEMAQEAPFGNELGLVGKALGTTFSGRVLGWQLGGTMAAALLYFLLVELPTNVDRGVGFVLTGLALILVYVILAATGCIIVRRLGAGAEGGEETGTGALHFLVDHIGAALLLPLVFAAAAIALAGVLCAPAALWAYETWQAILVIPSLLVFVLAVLVVGDLFMVLFIIPPMVASERPSFGEALRRLWRLFWTRKMELVKLFAIGLVVAIALAAPLYLLAEEAALPAISWVHRTATSAWVASFPQFVLRLAWWLLLLAPVLTLPLAFLNCLGAAAYGGLTEGLDAEDADVEVVDENEPELEIEGEPEKK